MTSQEGDGGGPVTYSLGTLCQLGERGQGFGRACQSAHSLVGSSCGVREYTSEPARCSSPGAGSRRLYARSIEQGRRNAMRYALCPHDPPLKRCSAAG